MGLDRSPKNRKTSDRTFSYFLAKSGIVQMLQKAPTKQGAFRNRSVFPNDNNHPRVELNAVEIHFTVKVFFYCVVSVSLHVPSNNQLPMLLRQLV